MKTNQYLLIMTILFLFLGLCPQITEAQTVKGTNVKKVEIGRTSAKEGTLVQSGPKEWTHYHGDGRLFVKYRENGRDEWSVYLSSSRFSSVIINLWLKTFVMKQGNSVFYSGKILSSSLQATNANVKAVKFYSRASLTLAQARNIAAQNGWELATPAQVVAAWQNKGLNAFAYGMTSNGTYCVPIQQNNGSFRRGHNCGVSGGNQGFLYVVKNQSGNTASTSTINRSAAVAKKRSPLTPNEMARVMKWISIKTSAARLPFCWRQSYGRTAGKPMVCQAGYKQETAGLCYQPCKAGEKGVATFCYRNCPAGFRDDGLYCGKPKAYGRGGGYPWKIGDRVGSLDGARARCSRANPQGCEKYGAIIYPKCRAGFKPAGSNICSPICPSGYTDIGVSCKKPNYSRDVKPLTRCAGGLQKDGALCYPKCRNDYTGRGPVCWQNCPVQQNVDCGAGCATTKGQCAKAVFNMTSAPIIAALKIAGLVATAGASSAATGGAAAAAKGSKLAASSPKLIKLASMLSKIKKLYEANKQTIKVAAGTYKVVTALQSEVNLFSKEFADNFGDMTTPEIEKEIDRRFSREAALAIKKEWAVHHISMNMEANTITTSKNFISVASVADPTGLSSVVNAFLNPLCKESTPFPTVRPKF